MAQLEAVAANLVAKQEFGSMVRPKAGKMDSVSLDEALENMKPIDSVYALARAVETFEDRR